MCWDRYYHLTVSSRRNNTGQRSYCQGCAFTFIRVESCRLQFTLIFVRFDMVSCRSGRALGTGSWRDGCALWTMW